MGWDWGPFVGEITKYFEKTRKQKWTKKEVVARIREMQVEYMKRTGSTERHPDRPANYWPGHAGGI